MAEAAGDGFLLLRVALAQGALRSGEVAEWARRLRSLPPEQATAEWLVAQGALTPEEAAALGAALQGALQSAEEETADIPFLGSSATPAWLPTVEGYEIVALVGEGGTGVVYKAWQRRPRRLVALKVLRGGAFATPAQRRRFEREAQAAADLLHPGIASVYELGDVAGQPYLSMAFVHGSRLDQYVQDRALPLRGRLALMQRICEVVAYAHQHGVIHRDLKPSNILIDESGQPKLLDFGTAKLTEASDAERRRSSTSIGQVIGTLSYMAPEQTLGQPDAIDVRTDVYALGAILYEMLTGSPPHGRLTGPLPEAVAAIREQRPQPPSKANPLVDGDAEAITLKALDLEAARRYQTAAELAADIQRYLSGGLVEARRASPLRRLSWWAVRHRARAVPAAGALLVIIAVVVIAFCRVRAERNAALRAEAQAEAAQQEAEAEGYRVKIRLAAASIASNAYAEAERALAACPERFRHWEWGHLRRLCHPEWRMLRGQMGPILAAGLSPDGGRVLATGQEGAVRVWDADTGHILSGFGTQARIGRVSDGFSPDGTRVVVADGADCAAVWDVEREATALVLRGHAAEVNGAAFSQDGARIVTGSSDRTARIWDATTGQQLLVLSGHQGSVRGGVFSTDGRRVATFSADGTARVWDCATGRELLVLSEGAEDTVESAAFSPDARVIVTAAHRAGVIEWGSASGQRVRTFRGHSRPVQRVAFSRDGSRIATASRDGTARIWDLATGDELARLSGHSGWVMSVVFGGDGRRVITAGADGTVRIWDLGYRHERLDLAESPCHVLAFSPDGRTMLGAGWSEPTDGRPNWDAGVFDATTGRQTAGLQGHDGFVGFGGFSSDGKMAATLDASGMVRVWDAASGTRLLQIKVAAYACLHPAMWSPDGERIIVVGREGKAELWDVPSGKEMATFGGGRVDSAAFSPDGRRVVTVHGDFTARVWDVGSAQEVLTLTEPMGALWSASFSSDGTRIVTTSEAAITRVWDASTGRELGSFQGHEEAVCSAAFSPDGARLATADRGGTVRLWHVASGQQLLVVPMAGVGGQHIPTWSSDGQRLMVASAGQMIVYLADRWPDAAE